MYVWLDRCIQLYQLRYTCSSAIVANAWVSLMITTVGCKCKPYTKIWYALDRYLPINAKIKQISFYRDYSAELKKYFSLSQGRMLLKMFVKANVFVLQLHYIYLVPISMVKKSFSHT